MQGPYIFTAGEPLDVTFTDVEGKTQHVALRPADEYHFTGPNAACNAFCFVQELCQRGVSFNDNSSAINKCLDSLSEEYSSELENLTPKQEEPPTLPSTTGIDGLPDDLESDEGLNPPTPNLGGEISEEPPGSWESTEKTPGEDRTRKQNPVPDQDIQGLWPDVEDARDNARKNKPLPGEQHPEFGKEDREPQDTVADPVEIFTGRYRNEATDAEIPSRGFPLRFHRIYRSGAIYYGSLGFNWDHGYNLYLRELSDGRVAVWTGNLNEDLYEPRAEGGFIPPLGVFFKLERVGQGPFEPDRYVLSDREGLRRVFYRPDDWPDPERIPLAAIEDRHGNVHRLTYLSEGRLGKVEDHAGRYLSFGYDHRGLLTQVIDHTGRRWRYEINPETDQLTGVTTPATADYPEGTTTHFQYDRFRSHPALVNNLTRVVDPEARTVVEIAYGDDPGTDDFGRVVREEYGGFEATFHATRLQYVPRVPKAINIPALRVEVIDPGVLRVHTFNYRGDLLDERFRLCLDGSYRLVARIFLYDDHGNLVERREPDGSGMRYLYDVENEDFLARSSLFKLEKLASPTAPAKSRILAQLTYEPRYNLLKTSKDERGAVTIFFYDHEEGTGGSGLTRRIELPEVKLPDGSAQQAVLRFSYNEFGQLTQETSAEGEIMEYVYFDSGPNDGYLQAVIRDPDGFAYRETYDYDLWGNLAKQTDTDGSESEFHWNEHNRLLTARALAGEGRIAEYLYRYSRSGTMSEEHRPRGRYVDARIHGDHIQDHYSYDVLGRLSQHCQGANMEAPRTVKYSWDGEDRVVEEVNSLGGRTLYRYDEYGSLLEQKLVADGQERLVRYEYDRNGRRTAMATPDGRRTDYGYDRWGRPSRVYFPEIDGARTELITIWGHSDLLEGLEIRGARWPGGTAQILQSVTFTHDERHRPWKSSHDGLNAITYWDRNDSVVREIDPRGHSYERVYDTLGRVEMLTDPLGNRIEYGRDHLDRVVAELSHELSETGKEDETRTSHYEYDIQGLLTCFTDPMGNLTKFNYDGRGLLISEIDPLGRVTEGEFNAFGELVLTRELLDGEAVENKYRRDAAGRVVAYIDPTGAETTYELTGFGETVAEVFPDGSRHRYLYGPAGQLTTETLRSGSKIRYSHSADGTLTKVHFEADQGISPTDPIEYHRDGLGRPMSIRQGEVLVELEWDTQGRITAETLQGQRTERIYEDALGRITTRYSDGRQDRTSYDALNRLASIELVTPGEAELTGPLSPGQRLLAYRYAGSRRIVERILANGLVSRFEYDANLRLTRMVHATADGATVAGVAHVYDALGQSRVEQVVPSPAQSRLSWFDELGQLVRVVNDILLPAIPDFPDQAAANAYLEGLNKELDGGGEETYELDTSGTRKYRRIRSGTRFSDTVYSSNRLHQIVKTAPPSSAGSAGRDYWYDGDGNRSGDTLHSYLHDASGRLTAIRNNADGATVARFRWDPLGRLIGLETAEGSEQFVYWDRRPIEVRDATNRLVLQRLFGLFDDECVLESNGQNQWLCMDGRFSHLARLDETGAVMQRFAYGTFGEPTVVLPEGVTAHSSESAPARPQFAGMSYLPCGLYVGKARIYDPALGHFLEPDPSGYGDGPNPYLYARHNPIDLYDPTGQWVESAWDVASLGLGVHSALDDLEKGSWFWFGLDCVGIAVDIVALALPIVPGFAGAGIKALRAAEKAAKRGTAASKFITSGFGRFKYVVEVTPDVLEAGHRARFMINTIRAPLQGAGAVRSTFSAYEAYGEGSYVSGTMHAAAALVGVHFYRGNVSSRWRDSDFETFKNASKPWIKDLPPNSTKNLSILSDTLWAGKAYVKNSMDPLGKNDWFGQTFVRTARPAFAPIADTLAHEGVHRVFRLATKLVVGNSGRAADLSKILYNRSNFWRFHEEFLAELWGKGNVEDAYYLARGAAYAIPQQIADKYQRFHRIATGSAVAAVLAGTGATFGTASGLIYDHIRRGEPGAFNRAK